MKSGTLFVVTSVSGGSVDVLTGGSVVAFGVVLIVVIVVVIDAKVSGSVVIPFIVSDMDIVVGIGICDDWKLISDDFLTVICVDEGVSVISLVVMAVVISVVDDIVGVGTVEDGTSGS